MIFKGGIRRYFLLIPWGLLVVLLPLLFLSTLSSAGKAAAAVARSQLKLRFPPSGKVALPFTFDDAKIHLPVRIGEEAVFTMHLDNAWSITTFTKQSIERSLIELGNFIKIPVRGIGGLSYIEGTTLLLEQFQIGELAVQNHRVVVLDWKDYPVDGIIGCEVIHRMITTIDYDNRQITFTRADLNNPLNPGISIREIIPFSINPWEGVPGGEVVLPVGLPGGKSMQGWLDLGSGQSIISWSGASELGISRFNPQLKSGGTLWGGDGRPVRSHVMELSSLQIGSITIKGPLKIYIADLDIFGDKQTLLIGNDILQHLGKITLNCNKNQLIVHKR
ncbi:MAG: pepsin/retropepsin-like aspartic protease family protein [Candidatus Aminicenantes bacterium]|nr:pepsin/retropepsin-like aspartic protease family protein [Candidatus Aminicenantes bacterium]MDH5715043.1 pepsin/retropepsin-like aspartic protease family protein [Candidatus Aminicenantes bacterium]